jgi:hypothetical protein
MDGKFKKYSVGSTALDNGMNLREIEEPPKVTQGKTQIQVLLQ